MELIERNKLNAHPRSITVTGDNSWATTLATAITLELPNSTYLTYLNIKGTSSAAATVILTLAGITFPAYNQAILCDGQASANNNYGFAIANTSTIQMGVHGATTGSWSVVGWLLSTSKPTWLE